MSLDHLTLLECPFCTGRSGQIGINAGGLDEFRRNYPNLDDAGSENAFRALERHEVVAFGSPAAAEGPCEHLLHVLIDFEASPGKWDACYAWKFADLDDVAGGYFWDVFTITTAPTLVPETECDYEEDELSWPVIGHDGQPVRLDIVGKAWFAADRARFVEELRALEDRRRELCATGKGFRAFHKLMDAGPR